MKSKKANIMSNVSERDKKLLFIFGSILVLAAAYFFAFRPNMEKADEIKAKNVELDAYIQELNVKIEQEEAKKAEIVTYNNSRAEVLDRFSGGVTHEKAIKILADLEKETGLQDSQVTLAINNVFFSQEEAMGNGVIAKENVQSLSSIAVAGTPSQTYNPLTGYKSTLTLEFACSDQELTDVIDFINEYDEKMAMDDITVGFDASTGKLTGTLTFSLYSASNIEKEYEAPVIDDVRLGVSNIFGAKNVASSKSKKK